MKILIVSATSEEITNKTLYNYDVLITGIGMINTTYMLTQRLNNQKYDLVLNMGVAGSFNTDFDIGKVVEVTSDSFSEFGSEDGEDFLPASEINLDININFKQERKTDLKEACAITVNTIHGNILSINNIKERLNPDIESMEGASVMMVCKKFNIPCLQIRAISNLVERRNKEKWDLPLAVKNLNKEVYNIINNL